MEVEDLPFYIYPSKYAISLLLNNMAICLIRQQNKEVLLHDFTEYVYNTKSIPVAHKGIL